MTNNEYRSDTITQPDPPDYPAEWTAQQRLTAYWHAVGHDITPNQTNSWHSILNQAENQADRRHTKISTIMPKNVIPLRKRK
jgi:hypothetical protein